jgi:hypothetical protein
MSSHHIIRDDQEPALFILEAEEGSNEAIGQWLEWSPLVMITEKSFHFAYASQIKVDVMICSHENEVVFKSLLQPQYPLTFILSPSERFLQAGLQHWGAKSIVVFTSVLEGLDQLLTTLANLRPDGQCSLLTPDARWVYCPSGQYEKHFAGNSMIALHLNGAKQLIEGPEFKLSNKGEWTSQVTGTIRIKSLSPFWIKEPVSSNV